MVKNKFKEYTKKWYTTNKVPLLPQAPFAFSTLRTF